MIDFSTTTAFRLVRQLAVSPGTPAMYLLISEAGTEAAVENDLREEVEVQLGSSLSIYRLAESPDSNRDIEELEGDAAGGIRLLRIDVWAPDLIGSLDSHVIRLEQTGAQFLFLTSEELSQRLVIAAPNFRNRLADVLRITPDDPSGGGHH
jgi:hypothetical protein